MKTISKALLISAALLFLLFFAAPVYEASSFTTVKNSSSFTKEWETTTTYDSAKGVLKYGFDTDFIDEDYCRCNHNLNSHQAQVENSYTKNTTNAYAATNETKWIYINHRAGESVYYRALY